MSRTAPSARRAPEEPPTAAGTTPAAVAVTPAVGAVTPPAGGAAGGADLVTEEMVRRAGPVRRFFYRHPALVDAVVVAWYVVPAVATVAATRVVDDPHRAPAVQAAVVLVTAAALALRRRVPLAVLAVATAGLVVSTTLVGDTTGTEFAAVLALYAVAAYRPTSTAWLALAGFVLVAGATFYLSPDLEGAGIVTTTAEGESVEVGRLQQILGLVVSTLVLAVVALGLGTAARGRREHVAGLVARTRQLVLERDQREQLAVSAERTRIAREMHDVVAHSLSVMVTLAEGASAMMTKNPDQARTALEELTATGRSALADTRRMFGVLREDDPPAPGPGAEAGGAAPLVPQPGAHDVAALVERFAVTGLPVTLREAGPPLPPDAGLHLAVYRIVQESLTNVLRYARLSPRIDVTIDREADRVRVTVDNVAGSTGSAMAGSGRGLIGIRERASVYGGSVEAGPTATGWRVRAVLEYGEGR